VKYAVTVRGRSFEVEIRGAEARVDGEVVHASLQGVPGTPLRVLALPEGLEPCALVRSDGGWSIHVQGEVWDARVVDERTRRLREMTGLGRAGVGHAVLRAPMPGRVVRVEVQVESRVRQGQPLVVLEAMKMENELAAPGAGTVTAVHVRAGEAVAKGAVLVELAGEG
jgi:biotin carboxyl carrier protein